MYLPQDFVQTNTVQAEKVHARQILRVSCVNVLCRGTTVGTVMHVLTRCQRPVKQTASLEPQRFSHEGERRMSEPLVRCAKGLSPQRSWPMQRVRPLCWTTTLWWNLPTGQSTGNAARHPWLFMGEPLRGSARSRRPALERTGVGWLRQVGLSGLLKDSFVQHRAGKKVHARQIPTVSCVNVLCVGRG
jgi:hypothetical protein